MHGLLHTATDLNQAKTGVKTLNAALTALVATESFTVEKLLEMTAINFYALFHTTSTEELTHDEIIVKELILDLLAGSLSAFLIPVHTLKVDEHLLDYYALPSGNLKMKKTVFCAIIDFFSEIFIKLDSKTTRGFTGKSV